jgi:hypothetical protein
MMVQVNSRWLPTSEASSSFVGVEDDKVALGRVFYEYFRFYYQFSFY